MGNADDGQPEGPRELTAADLAAMTSEELEKLTRRNRAERKGEVEERDSAVGRASSATVSRPDPQRRCDLIARRLTPEEEELERKRSELAALQSTLAERELELATLRAELSAFELRYLTTVGARYARLDHIKAQYAEARARRKPKDEAANAEATAARDQAEASGRAAGDAADRAPQESFEPSGELKKLYRQVAKSVHPDLATEEEERNRRQGLMADANRAYEEGDEKRLRAILREWEHSPESVKGGGPAAELVRTIRKIAQVQERIRAIEDEIAELQGGELFALKAKVDAAEERGRDLLGEMASRVDAETDAAKSQLGEMKREANEW